MKRYLIEVDDNATADLVAENDDLEAVRINFEAKRLVITVLPDDPNEWPAFIEKIGVTKDD